MASSSIKILPTEVVHLIAAGEVIDSLAAVVRELVENALDASATRITISIWPEQWRVRVADNGTGMDLADLRYCATAHSTSKIRSIEDLWKITSLGFRGEALHSLTALAELEILSRPNPQKFPDQGRDEGWRVTYNQQGESLEVATAAIAPGTVVTVSNLFGTWPVRRQGLPSPAQQLRAVQATIHQIALCHPHVTWQVHQNERLWFAISPGATAQEILPQILRDVHVSDLQQLYVEVPAAQEQFATCSNYASTSQELGELPGWQEHQATGKSESQHLTLNTSNSSVNLVLGLPDRCYRRRPDWVRVAMNGRMVKSPELEQTILGAFMRTMPRDRYPICFLHLAISPAQIDWNRHPAKAEVYLHGMSYWQEQINKAIEQSLHLNLGTGSASPLPKRVGKLLALAEAKNVYSTSRSISPTPEGNRATTANEIGLMELKAVAQVHNTYVVAEHPAGLWLVEQHIAHERVLYEQLCDAWQLIPLEPPAILNHLSPARVEQLQRIGCLVEPFGDHVWAVRTAPKILCRREDCVEALDELSWGGDLQAAQVATACRSAIRNGTPLTLPEMQTLLEQWQRTRHPRTCPHGRPIYLSLEESALARFFRRHWVIGKSHGIA